MGNSSVKKSSESLIAPDTHIRADAFGVEVCNRGDSLAVSFKREEDTKFCVGWVLGLHDAFALIHAMSCAITASLKLKGGGVTDDEIKDELARAMSAIEDSKDLEDAANKASDFMAEIAKREKANVE